MAPHSHSIFIFGLGYVAGAFAQKMRQKRYTVMGTVRSEVKARALSAEGYRVFVYDSTVPFDLSLHQPLQEALLGAEGIVSSIAPNSTDEKNDSPSHDPVLRDFGALLSAVPDNKPWLGYLSTTGVYGDHAGAWVDETSACKPLTQRSRKRFMAERGWQNLANQAGLLLTVFRLSGIYGPARGPLQQLLNNKARRVEKPDQVFNRVHVSDIVQALQLGLAQRAHGVFNISDDLPAPPQDVIAYGAQCLKLPIPPLVLYERAELSAMARSFYAENKRVSNQKSKAVLGLQYRYPSYKKALPELAGKILTQ